MRIYYYKKNNKIIKEETEKVNLNSILNVQCNRNSTSEVMEEKKQDERDLDILEKVEDYKKIDSILLKDIILKDNEKEKQRYLKAIEKKKHKLPKLNEEVKIKKGKIIKKGKVIDIYNRNYLIQYENGVKESFSENYFFNRKEVE